MATDFFTAEVWTLAGLVTYYVFFLIELARRKVHIAGITAHPHELWMLQIASNLTDASAQFGRLIAVARTAVIRLPPRSPNLNAHAGYIVIIPGELVLELDDGKTVHLRQGDCCAERHAAPLA